MGELIDAGTGFARAGVTGYEPATAKLIATPFESPKSGNSRFLFAWKQQ